MALISHIYQGDAYWWETRRVEENEIAAEKNDIAEVTSKIRSLYDAGAPLYTKEMIQDIDRQLEIFTMAPEASKRGQKVSLRGLDESIVDFEIESGLTLPGGSTILGSGNDLEMVLRDPFIHYVPIQVLTSKTENCIPRIAYCSLRIYHYMDERNRFTKELVNTIPTQPREEIEGFFQTIRNTWEASKACQQLRSILMSIRTPCDKIVGLALGVMAYGSQDRGSRRAAFQHALILTLRDLFSEKGTSPHQGYNPQPGAPIMCYAQDPAYTEVDRSVLEGHGITILGDPKGFLEVNDSTAVISCAPSLSVKQIVSDLAQPAVMIWDRVSKDNSEVPSLDSDSPRIRKEIYNCYDSFQFPGNSEHFGDIVIYVRRLPT